MTFRDPAYLGNADAQERHIGYSPEWLDRLADDVTLEGAAIQGLVEGAQNVREVVARLGKLQEFQEVDYDGKCAHNCRLEDYVTQIQGQPTGVVTMTYHDDSGTVEHVIINHRPRSSVVLVSDLLGREFVASPLDEHFGAES